MSFRCVGEVVTLQEPDNLPHGGRLEIHAFIGVENLIGLVLLFCLIKEDIDGVVVDLTLLIKKVGGKQILSLAPGTEATFDANLDEQDFGDLVKGRSRIFLFTVSDDIVTLVQEISELILLKDFQACQQLLGLLYPRRWRGGCFRFPPVF